MAKQKEKNPIAAGIILIVLFSLMLLLVIAINIDILTGSAEDYYTVADGKGIEKGDYVSIDINTVLDNYAETKHTVNFIPVGKDQHFVLLMDNGDVISLTVKNKKKIKELKKICEQSWAYYVYGTSLEEPNTMTLKGRVATFDPEVEDFYHRALVDMGISAAEYNIYYVTIDATETPVTIALYILACILLIALGVVTIKSEKKQKKKVEEARALAAATNAGTTSVADNIMGTDNQEDTTYGTSGNYEGVNKDLLK